VFVDSRAPARPLTLIAPVAWKQPSPIAKRGHPMRGSIAVVLLTALFAAAAAEAAVVPLTIEPDDYPNGTVLDTILPQVVLEVADQNNDPFSLFKVTANVDGQNYAPTGQSVFGRSNVTFWNNGGRLKMTFTVSVSAVSLDFGSGSSFTPHTGRLEIYDSGDSLLDTYVTQPLLAGSPETMALTSPAGDIAWAVAYLADGEGSFGRFDHLTFIPEPATLTILAFGGLMLFRRKRQ
jgi:hypothetical protein